MDMTKYIWHTNTTTNHNSRIYRADVADNFVDDIKTWLQDLDKGQIYILPFGDNCYSVRREWHTGKAAAFVIERLDNMMQPTELIRFSVCRHSRKKAEAWMFAGGAGEPPQVPFTAAGIVSDNFTVSDQPHIMAFADFERCLAWAWLESLSEQTS